MSVIPQPPDVTVTSQAVGQIVLTPPTFLEKWGVVFVACVGCWILAVGTAMLVFYLRNLPEMPSLSGLSADQARDALTHHKEIYDQWRDSLNQIFDLLVTKTALPIVTLLLGYLFGKRA